MGKLFDPRLMWAAFGLATIAVLITVAIRIHGDFDFSGHFSFDGDATAKMDMKKSAQGEPAEGPIGDKVRRAKRGA